MPFVEVFTREELSDAVRAKLAETLLVTMMNLELGHPTDHAWVIGWVCLRCTENRAAEWLGSICQVLAWAKAEAVKAMAAAMTSSKRDMYGFVRLVSDNPGTV